MKAFYKICFYHGKDKSIKEKISKFCQENEQNDFIFYGSLNAFQDLWKEKFLVFPDDSKETLGTICVTHKAFFSHYEFS